MRIFRIISGGQGEWNNIFAIFFMDIFRIIRGAQSGRSSIFILSMRIFRL